VTRVVFWSPTPRFPLQEKKGFPKKPLGFFPPKEKAPPCKSGTPGEFGIAKPQVNPGI